MACYRKKLMEHIIMEVPEDKAQKHNRDYLDELQEECNKEEQRIKAELEKLGHTGTWQEFIVSQSTGTKSLSRREHPPN